MAGKVYFFLIAEYKMFENNFLLFVRTYKVWGEYNKSKLTFCR